MESFCQPIIGIHVQPCCPEFERAVLGAMLLHVSVRRQLRNSLRAEDFYEPEHQRLFQHLCVLSDPTELATLKANLSAGYFDALIEQACRPEDVPHHARKLHQRFVLRQLLEAQAEFALDLQAS